MENRSVTPQHFFHLSLSVGLGLVLLLVLQIGNAYAVTPDDKYKIQVKKEYGDKLQSVPYFLRMNYFNKTGKGWPKASYEEREEFLINYEKKVADDKALQAIEDKEKQKRENDAAREKQNRLSIQKQKLRAELQKQKEEEKIEADRKRRFQKAIQDQNKEMQLLKKGRDR